MSAVISLAGRMPARAAPPRGGSRPLALAEALDRLLHVGVMAEGNLTLGLAGVDLLFVDLRLVAAAVDTLWPDGRPGAAPPPPPRPEPPRPAGAAAEPARPASAPPAPAANATATPPKSLAGGLAKLVLTLVKLLHDVLERAAVRRMENGHLTAAEIENIGAALAAQAGEIEQLRRDFGFADADLAIDLRPDRSS